MSVGGVWHEYRRRQCTKHAQGASCCATVNPPVVEPTCGLPATLHLLKKLLLLLLLLRNLTSWPSLTLVAAFAPSWFDTRPKQSSTGCCKLQRCANNRTYSPAGIIGIVAFSCCGRGIAKQHITQTQCTFPLYCHHWLLLCATGQCSTIPLWCHC